MVMLERGWMCKHLCADEPYADLHALQGMVTERLKRALDQGWVAREAVEEAQLLCRSLEEAKQKHMEETYGRAAGAA